jgi:undecaprenyl-diphosphatase
MQQSSVQPMLSKFWLLLSIAILVALSVFFYFCLDMRIAAAAYNHPQSWPDAGFFDSFKQLGKAHIVIWLIIIWAMILRSPRLAVAGLLAMVFLAAAVLPLKASIDRPRPKFLFGRQAPTYAQTEQHKSDSFPSGDTATAFAAVVSIGAFVRKRWLVVLIPAAAMIGVLRVLESVHFPSDVCAGAAAGILSGALGVLVCRCHLVQNPIIFKGPESEWFARWPAYLGWWLLVALIPGIAWVTGDQSFRMFFTNCGLLSLIPLAAAVLIGLRQIFKNLH